MVDQLVKLASIFSDLVIAFGGIFAVYKVFLERDQKREDELRGKAANLRETLRVLYFSIKNDLETTRDSFTEETRERISKKLDDDKFYYPIWVYDDRTFNFTVALIENNLSILPSTLATSLIEFHTSYVYSTADLRFHTTPTFKQLDAIRKKESINGLFEDMKGYCETAQRCVDALRQWLETEGALEKSGAVSLNKRPDDGGHVNLPSSSES